MKSKIVAILLCLFLGALGAHNFYLGKYLQGGIQLVICLIGWILLFPYAILAIWVIYDLVKIIITPEPSLGKK